MPPGHERLGRKQRAQARSACQRPQWRQPSHAVAHRGWDAHAGPGGVQPAGVAGALVAVVARRAVRLHIATREAGGTGGEADQLPGAASDVARLAGLAVSDAPGGEVAVSADAFDAATAGPARRDRTFVDAK